MNRSRKVFALACLTTLAGCPASEPSSPPVEPAAPAQVEVLEPPSVVDPPPEPAVLASVAFARDAGEVEEGAGTYGVELVLGLEGGPALREEVVVSLTLVDGKDLLSLPESPVTFPVGAQSGARVTVELGLVDDRRPEPDAVAALELSAPRGASLGDLTRHSIRVQDDDVFVINTIAGHKDTVYQGETAATKEPFQSLVALTLGPDGALWVVDERRHQIRRVDLEDGVVTTPVNHSGANGRSQEGIAAKWAVLSSPQDIVFTPDGSALLIADRSNSLIRRLDLATSVVTTLAGDGRRSPPEDGQPLTASIAAPEALCFAPDGRLLVIESESRRLLALDLEAGTVHFVAGNGSFGSSGDGGPATSAQLAGPTAICVDPSGAMFLNEPSKHRVRRIDPDGTIANYAGCGEFGLAGDGGPAAAAQVHAPRDLALDAEGNLFILEQDSHRIRRVDARTGTITTVAGRGSPGATGDGGPALKAELSFPEGLWVAPDGLTIFVADTRNRRIRKIEPGQK